MRYFITLVLLLAPAVSAFGQAQPECYDVQSPLELRELVGKATPLTTELLIPGSGPNGSISYCTANGSVCWYMRVADAERVLSADSSFVQVLNPKLLRPLRNHRAIAARMVTLGAERWGLMAFEPVNCSGDGCNNRYYVGIPAIGMQAQAFVLMDVTPFIPFELRFFESRNRLGVLSSERVQPGRWRLLFGPEDRQQELGEFLTLTDGGLKVCRIQED